MKKIYWLIVILLSTVEASAQSGKITGTVIDNQSKAAIPFATVAVDQNNSLGTFSDSEGRFEITKIENGSYSISISFIGYKSRTIKVDKNRANISLENITLERTATELDEVVVSGTQSTMQKKIDRQLFRSSDFETAKGGSGIDLMNKLPSVSVSPDGEVSVRGTNDFIVYLNGKPTQIEPSMLLGQLSSNDISNIEVITVPSAKYDAQGKGGIINISTKKTGVDGLSVSINGNLGGSPWHNSTDKYDGYKMNDNRYGVGANAIYMKDDISIFGSFSYNSKNVNGARDGNAKILQSDGSYYNMVASGERPEWYEYISGNLGMDWKISERSDLSIGYFYGNRYEGRSAFYIYNNFYSDPEPIDSTSDWIYNPNTDNRRGVFNSIDIDYTTKLTDQTELYIAGVYENSSLKRDLDNLNYDYDKTSDKVGAVEEHYRQSDDTPLNSYTFTAALSRELDNGDLLEIGVQPRIFNMDGVFNYDTLNVQNNIWGAYESLENSIDLKRNIYAAYANYTGSTDKLNYILGVRMEYTDQLMKISNPDYFNIFDRESKSEFEVKQADWFPTIHMEYKLNEENKLSLAANRRISRPPIKNMAPFLYRRHYEVYIVGDPELEAENSTTVELGYNTIVGDQTISLVGFYRGTENAVFRVNTVYEEENVLIRSFTNSGTTTSLGAELNVNSKIGSYLKLFLGGSLYSYRVQGDIFGYKEDNQSINYSVKGNVIAKLSKEISWTTDFDLKSATVTAQGEDELYYMTNTAFSYTPKQLKGWNFSLGMQDLFGSNKQGLNTRVFDENKDQIFYQETTYNRTGQIATLRASYSFNSFGKKAKANKAKTAGDKEF